VESRNELAPTHRQWLKLSEVPNPANKWVLIDEHPDSINDGYFYNPPASQVIGLTYQPPITTALAASPTPMDIRPFTSGRLPKQRFPSGIAVQLYRTSRPQVPPTTIGSWNKRRSRTDTFKFSADLDFLTWMWIRATTECVEHYLGGTLEAELFLDAIAEGINSRHRHLKLLGDVPHAFPCLTCGRLPARDDSGINRDAGGGSDWPRINLLITLLAIFSLRYMSPRELYGWCLQVAILSASDG